MISASAARPVLILCLVLAALPAQPVQAGAWLEQPGAGFASVSATYRQAGNGSSHELGYYAAYGLTPRLTLGADLNQAAEVSGHALVFARLSLHSSSRYRLAAEVAIGGNHTGGVWQMMQKTTLSYGQTIRAAGSDGWLSIEAAYELRNNGLDAAWKLDATLGLNRRGKAAPMLQIETSKPEGGRFSYALTPALRYPLKQRRELILGLEYRQSGQQSLGLELGLWQRF